MQNFTRGLSRRHVLQMVAAQPAMFALARAAVAEDAKMHVMQFDKYGDPDVFYGADVPRPQPGAGEILIQVKAIGTNPVDTYLRYGKYAARGEVKFPRIVGVDAAGIVTAVGSGVTDFKPGDRVVASTKTGAYATYAVARTTSAAKLPDSIDFETAAALPCAGLTGCQLVEEGLPKLKAGQTVMVTGATGSVGRFALYAARAKGAKVIAAVRGAYVDEAKALGAESAIATEAELPANFRVDYIADTIGGKVASKLCQAIAPGGTIITSVTAPNGDAGIDAATVPVKPDHLTYHHDGKRLAQIVADVKAGKVSMPIVQRLPLKDAAEAHRLLEKGGSGGKIILIPA